MSPQTAFNQQNRFTSSLIPPGCHEAADISVSMSYMTAVMPEFSDMTDETLEPMLPRPLLDCYRLSKSYIRFVETARALPRIHQRFIKEVLKAKSHGCDLLHSFQGILVQTMERLHDDTFLADEFQELMELSAAMDAPERGELLRMLDDLAVLATDAEPKVW